MENGNKLLIFSAPSGAGKSTIIQHLLKQFPNLEFSVSATSRNPRGEEKESVDYYFLTNEQFKSKAENGEFIEWEEVYAGTCYGTLHSEAQRIWDKGNTIVFDIDVVGGNNLKAIFGDKALSIFIQPPSLEELHKRLIGRATDTPEAIERRIAKAEQELQYKDKFDVIIVNDKLETALEQAAEIVGKFIK